LYELQQLLYWNSYYKYVVHYIKFSQDNIVKITKT
jgi:hypothetical protein